MTNAAEISDSKYKLEIAHDVEPLCPRKNDNFGTMVCWHSRYNFGDKHEHSDMSDLLKSLIREGGTSEEAIVSYVKSGKAENLRLEYDKPNNEWELKSYDSYFKAWYAVDCYDAPLNKAQAYIADDILESMRTTDLLNLAEKTHMIKPLFLYDHSVQSISTASFVGRAHHASWDSGEIGVVYASFEAIKNEYGDVSPENIEKAESILNGEVADYDKYIRGECYGFKLFENGEEQDGCWGFVGDFDSAMKQIAEHLPKEAVYLAKKAEYGECKIAAPKKDLLGRISKAQEKVTAQNISAPSKDRKKSTQALE